MPARDLFKHLNRFCDEFKVKADQRRPIGHVGEFTFAHRYSGVHESQKRYGYQVWAWNEIPPVRRERPGEQIAFVVLEGGSKEGGGKARYFVLEATHATWLRKKLRAKGSKRPQLQVNIQTVNAVRRKSAVWRAAFVAAREVEETKLRGWLEQLEAGRYPPPPYLHAQ